MLQETDLRNIRFCVLSTCAVAHSVRGKLRKNKERILFHEVTKIIRKQKAIW